MGFKLNVLLDKIKEADSYDKYKGYNILSGFRGSRAYNTVLKNYGNSKMFSIVSLVKASSGINNFEYVFPNTKIFLSKPT